MFKEFGRLLATHPWTVCAIWLVLALVLALAPSERRAGSPTVQYLPEHCTSVRAHHHMQTAFPQALDDVDATTVDMLQGLELPLFVGCGAAAFIVLLACRAPLLAVIPIISNGVSLWISLKLLGGIALLPIAHLTDDVILLALLLPLGVGAGQSLYLLSRYREECTRGQNVAAAIAATIGSAGLALLAAAGVAVLTFGLLLFAQFGTFATAGPVLLLTMSLNFLAVLTLTAALLRLFNKAVFWPNVSPGERNNLARRMHLESIGLWDLFSRRVAKRPLPFWLLPWALLLPVAIFGLNELSKSGEPVPTPVEQKGDALTVLLSTSADWTSREGRIDIDHLTRGFSGLPHVASVRSAVQPHLSKLDITLKSPPGSRESLETLELVKTWLKTQLPRTTLLQGQITADCHGVTAAEADALEVIDGDRTRVCTLIILALFAIMLSIVHRPGLAFHLLAAILLACCTALGLGVAVANLVGGGIDVRSVLLVFVVLSATAASNTVLLMLRAVEEKKRHGTREGMRQALAQTGTALTWGGLIVAATAGSLAFAEAQDLTLVGLALAAGVLLDALVLRPMVIPAFAQLFWEETTDLTIFRVSIPRKPQPAPKSEVPKTPGNDSDVDDLYEWILASAPSAAP